MAEKGSYTHRSYLAENGSYLAEGREVIWQRRPIINRDKVLFHRCSLFKTHTDQQQWNIRNISRNMLNPRADRQRRASCGEPKLASL